MQDAHAVDLLAGGDELAHDARRVLPPGVGEDPRAGEEVYGVRVLTSSLEDAYLEAVGEGR